MSDVNEILKTVTASIEDATSKFNAKAEDALKEAQKSGKLSEETKASVDKMATELNAMREAEKSLKAALGELEQHVAQMPLSNAAKVVETVGQVVINSEALKAESASVFRLTQPCSQQALLMVLLNLSVCRVSIPRPNSDCLSVI